MAPGFFAWAAFAAQAMAAAVFRPQGSKRNWPGLQSGNSFRSRVSWSAPATIKKFSGGESSPSLKTVSFKRETGAPTLRNCLGLALRERGHRRVPLPPARITGVKSSVFIFLHLEFLNFPIQGRLAQT